MRFWCGSGEVLERFWEIFWERFWGSGGFSDEVFSKILGEVLGRSPWQTSQTRCAICHPSPQTCKTWNKSQNSEKSFRKFVKVVGQKGTRTLMFESGQTSGRACARGGKLDCLAVASLVWVGATKVSKGRGCFGKEVRGEVGRCGLLCFV